MAAGDGGLVAVTISRTTAEEGQLVYARADMMGRLVDPLRAVDPACSDPECPADSFDVVWTGGAFVVLYFVTDDPLNPLSGAEMRMVRLVPET